MVVSRRLLILMTLALPAACTLPLNSALRDGSRQARVAVNRPEPHALAAYVYALGVLWDGAPLNVQPAAFAPAATEPAIREISMALSAASADTPPRWATNEVTSPRPTYEDRSFARRIRAAEDQLRRSAARTWPG